MLMRFKNRTNTVQQINLISGGGIKVLPRTPQGGYVDLDISTMYKEEFERAQKFFEITPVVMEKKVENYNFPRKKRY